MRIALPLVAATLLLATSAHAGGDDTLSAERVVFHTSAGNLVFALYPNAAPKTVQQFLKMARAGLYDGVSFGRIHPGFIAQISSAQNRATPLTVEQSALLQKLPLEASSLKHVRGALSLAHPDDDPNGGEFSFCVLLGSAPHLDGKYTVFGELVAGDGVLNEIVDVPRNAQLVPAVRIGVDRVDVYESTDALSHVYVVPPHPVAKVAKETAAPREDNFMIAGILAVALLAALGGLLRDALSARVMRAMSLAALLICAFLLLMLLAPDGQHRPWLATALFFGLIAVFRALGKFEQSAGQT